MPVIDSVFVSGAKCSRQVQLHKESHARFVDSPVSVAGAAPAFLG